MKYYLKKHWLSFTLVSLLMILYSGILVGVSLLLQYVIDYALEGKIATASLLSVGYVALFTFVYFLESSGRVTLNATIMTELRSAIMEKILKKSTKEFYEHNETDYISLVQNDVKRIEDTYLTTIFSSIGAFTQLVLAILVMTNYSPIFTLTMFGMTIAMFVVPAIFSKLLQAATESVSDAQQGLTQGVSEVVLGFEVIKSFQKEDYRLGKFSFCNQHLKKCTKHLELLKTTNEGLSNSLGSGMQMVICILAGYFIYKKSLSYGSMVGVIQVSGSIVNPLFQLFTLIPSLKAFKPIFEKIASYTDCADSSTSSPEASDWKELSLQDVSFSYKEGERKILHDVNLNIERGKKYLIVGESGCGKSTLVNILSGKLSPCGGEVLLDGNALSSGNPVLQRISSGVWQNVYLFNESIRDNILMGDPNDGDVPEILEEAALIEVTSEKGMDFVVGANGDQLSGGQKQRIAIARALHAHKDILILDEGFSALDAEMGQQIEKKLLEKKDQTIISISHHATDEIRSLYDEIIEVKNGRVA
ncbi:MAG: ABC transporter ATP-binding protein [Lachnospiraceae bacterium]|jgi:ABC-type multidrug transport system fused ATPase/permease subunit|nr:ABC transporter ATP-binding protein [Lachnospiraceae bacterium]